MFFSQVSNSGDLVFIDSSGGMEEYNLRVFDVVTYSPVGALPLGLIITSDETTDTLTRAFTMYTRCLDGKSFYGRGGEVGPAVVMTDKHKREYSVPWGGNLRYYSRTAKL